MSNSLLRFVGHGLTKFLTRDVRGSEHCTTNSATALRRTIEPGDVLLVEGCTRVSTAVQYLTQSTWSHAALCTGPIDGAGEASGEAHVLVEANLGEGVVSAPLSRYANTHTRICRPVGLTAEDRAAVVGFATARIGIGYDTRNIFDLMRYLLPTQPVPQRFRRQMLALGSGSPTRVICSTLIAQAFDSIRYPILPRVEALPADAQSRNYAREILHIRHYSLYTPRDFDISPYFAVIKPTIMQGFDFHGIAWADRAPAVP